MISNARFILASFYHYRRSNAATAIGVIVATVVFTGAFLVGHSMRASLQELALDAIGSIDHAILAPRFMPGPSADSDAKGAILLQGTLESSDASGTSSRRVRSVKIYGVTPDFWGFWNSSLTTEKFIGREIILNRSTADALRAESGDSIIVRLPRFQEVPSESIFAHKDRTESLRLKVSRVIPDQDSGRFTLNPSQHTPMLAYIPLETLQKQLEVQGKVNAVLIAGELPKIKSLAQIGLHVDQPKDDEPDATFFSTDRMLFIPGSEEYLAEKVSASPSVSGGAKVQPVLTYLANSIKVGDREVPYSTVTAYDLESLAYDEIALNAWAAEQLGAKVGDTVTLRYFQPNSAHAGYAETTHELHLVAILPMEGQAIDRRWTPSVPGITDELTMADWDPPFPFDIKKIRPEDEAYWEKYKATPKAFVSYRTGKRLWGSQYGNATSLRVTPSLEAKELDSLAKELDPAEFGLATQDVRRRALEASVGTTSFEGLFLGLSFFVIAAALILVALMFRLGIDARARQVGLLAAVGFSRRRIAMLLLGEGLAISILGSLIGVLLGVLYARLLVFGLSTWWIGAIGTPFLSLHVAPGTLLLGFVAGTVTSAAVITLSIRRLMRIAPNQLLAGQTELAARYDRLRTRRRVAWAVTLNLWAAVVAILVAYFTVGIEARYETLTFFLSGVLTLAATLATIRLALAVSAHRPMLKPQPGNRLRFAARGAARHPMRSMAIVGMMASTVFLVVAIGAFRIEPVTNDRNVNGPTGGFQLVGQADVPIFGELNWGLGWKKFGFSEKEQRLLEQCRFIAFRVNSGDNASCLNLFRPGRPQILGVPNLDYYTLRVDTKRGNWLDELNQLGHDKNHGQKKQSQTEPKENQPVDVALEKNVANYSFQLWGGIGETFNVATDSDEPLELKVEALLGPTPFLGNLLISERDFERCFPDVEGYRFFLIRTPEGKEEAVRAALERALGDYGFAAERTVDRIASVSVVQNTYLATFQSLGGLGLLLGLFGLLAVEVRNVMERRGELALLSAVGFQRRTLVTLLTLENGLLLVAGLVSGLVAAVVAIFPHLLDTTASVPVGLLALILGVVLLISFFGLPPTAMLALRHIHTRDIQRDR